MPEEKPKKKSKAGRKTTHIKFPRVSDKQIRELVAQFPRGVSFERLKFAFVDHVVNNNRGCLTAAGRELDVCYRTVLHWIHGDTPATAKSRGRYTKRPSHDSYLFGTYAKTKIVVE